MTPDDVKAILDKAKANSEDPDQIDAMYARVLENFSGDDQALADAWALWDAISELQGLVAEGRRAVTGHAGPAPWMRPDPSSAA